MLTRHALGQTPLTVSAIGLGTVKFGRNTGVKYPTAFDLPTDHQILALLDCAESLGINLLDTAPAYGISETRLGSLLGSRRKNFVISTKVGETYQNGQSFFDYSSAATKASVEQSLRRLNTDFLDIVLIHSNGEDEKIIQETDIFETLHRLKEEGILRAIGISSKTVAGGRLALKYSDAVMVTYNSTCPQEQVVIAEAHAQGRGVLIKKALMSGHLSTADSHQHPIESAMRFVFKEPGIHSVIIGTLSQKHLEENVAFAIQAINA